MEILELLETLRTEDASVRRLFGSEGVGMRHLPKSQSYQRRLVETAAFLADVVEGRRPSYHLREAMTTSDFPLLFGDILDRQVLANYREWPSAWTSYCKRATVPDFRLVKRFAVSGAEAVLEEVPEQGEYPASKLSESKVDYSVRKYGRRLPFSWETLINDDMDALSDIPAKFGRASRRSEDRFATELHVDADGPHAGVYTIGNGNIITGNPPLSIEGLQEAMTVLGSVVDDEGEPIIIDMITLEVPSTLEVIALNILNALEIWITDPSGGGDSNQTLNAQNWMKSRFKLSVNPYIPLVAIDANGATSWFLHASPGNGRPPFELGFLRGHTEPEIFVKEPNARRVGGGVNPLDGDFDTDSIDYKVRHVFGGSLIDPKMTVASNGSSDIS